VRRPAANVATTALATERRRKRPPAATSMGSGTAATAAPRPARALGATMATARGRGTMEAAAGRPTTAMADPMDRRARAAVTTAPAAVPARETSHLRRRPKRTRLPVGAQTRTAVRIPAREAPNRRPAPMTSVILTAPAGSPCRQRNRKEDR
jgi:hypothetical protein